MSITIKTDDPFTLEPFPIRPGELWGEWHLREVGRRARVLKAWRDSRTARRRIYKSCRRDFFFWADNFLWNYDPRETPKKRAFVLFPFQRELARIYLGIEGFRDDTGSLWPMLVPKSRDIGGTWGLVAPMTWGFQFLRWDIGIISRVRDDVDDGTIMPTTVMGKIRWVIAQQPVLMRPHGFKYADHKRDQRYDKRLQMYHPDGAGSILGSSTVSSAFRSRRMKRILVDEANHVPKLEQVLDSVQGACEAPALLSTVMGTTHGFPRLCMGKMGQVTHYELPKEGR